MNKRFLFLALGTLLISLLSGAVVSGSAQTPMTETYTWQPYGLTVSYAADWTVVEKTSAISLRPEGRDVTDGRGPELVLFDVPDAQVVNLQNTLLGVAGGTGAINGAVQRGTLDGHSTVSTDLTWTNPDATGGLMLIAVDSQTVIGTAYVVRATEAADYLPVLEAMRDSLSFPDRAGTVASAESSSSVASVQLPQPYVWEQTGLVLHLPDNWKVDFQQDLNGDTLVATPDPATARGDDIYHVLQGSVLTNTDLNTVAMVSARNYQDTTTFVDTTVAGQPGITYDAYDNTGDLAMHFRPLFVSLPDGRIAALIFSTRDTGWDQFRPAVSAMISSIALASSDTAAHTTTRTLVSRTTSLPAQEPAAPQPFVWEEFGISFMLPDGWTSSLGNGQNYDVALVSPEANQNNGVGAFITLHAYPGLATAGNTFEAALQPIADQVKSDIQTRTINGVEITYISSTDETQGVDLQFVLVPYGTKGDAIYIQTSTPTAGGDEAIQGIIDSMVVNVIEPDVAAVDTAWQTSLADQGRLIVGDPNAPIKMREYLSYTCPHCVHYSRTIERLIALDVQTGRVQYEFAPLLLNKDDTLAQNATQATYCAAEQGKGYSASEALFQADLEQTPQVAYTPDGIKQALAPLGLDMDAFNTCMNEGRYLDKLSATGTEFSDQGLTGTPTVTLGVGNDPLEAIVLPDGQIWSGAIPLQFLHEIFSAVIDHGMTIQEYFQQ
jgi:protein-disulfide isomerase